MIYTIIPVYNGAQYIQEAIDSALNQTRANEIVVVDDGSTDATPEILRRYENAAEYPSVRVIRQANAGHIAARNRGAQLAQPDDWLAFLDADDIWEANKLEKQLNLIEAAPKNQSERDVFDDNPIRPARLGLGLGLGLVYTERLNFGAIDSMPERQSQSQILYDGPGDSVFFRLLETNFITVSSVLIQKSVYDQLGGFDASATGCEDWDLWLRLTAAGYSVGCVREPLTRYRWLENAMSRNVAKMHNGRMVALNKAFSGPLKDRIDRRCRAAALASINEISGWVAAMAGNRSEALAYYWQSLRLKPFQFNLWKQIIKLALGFYTRST